MPQLVKQEFPKRIIFFVCSNGKGHSTRSSIIFNHFKSYFKKSEFLIIGASSRFSDLRSYDKVMERTLIPTKSMSELKSWKAFFDNLEVTEEDLIISDNLVEPALFKDRVVIIGSHLWHEETTHFRISDMHRNFLKTKIRPSSMFFHSQLFSKNYHNMYRSTPLGLFGSKKTNLPRRDKIKNILFCGGRGGFEGRKVIAELANSLIKKMGNSFRYFGDSYFVGENVKKFSFKEEDFQKIDCIITRATIGMITEALSRGKKPILFPPDDTEMIGNSELLIKNNYAFSWEKYITIFPKVNELITDFDNFGAEEELLKCLITQFNLGPS